MKRRNLDYKISKVIEGFAVDIYNRNTGAMSSITFPTVKEVWDDIEAKGLKIEDTNYDGLVEAEFRIHKISISLHGL